MSLRTLPTLSALFGTAFRLAGSRLGTLLPLALFPLVPLALFGPFVAQVLVAAEEGLFDPAGVATRVSPWTAVLAFLGLIGSFVFSVASAAGMLTVLGRSADPGPRTAFREGVQSWVAFVWTQLLAALAVLAAAIPGLLVFWWAQRMLGAALNGSMAIRLLALLVPLLLMVPAFVVAVWYAFAVIPAARGEARGPTALAVSRRLVEGATGHVFGILLAWSLAEVLLWALLALLLPGLTLLQGLVYYLTTSILGSAYLVAVYQALRRS